MIEKQSIYNLIENYLEQETSKKEEKIEDEIDGYVRLEAVLPTLSIILKLTPNGIKKYLEDTKVIKFESGRYLPCNFSKTINDRLYIRLDRFESLVRLQVFVSIIENDEMKKYQDKYDAKRSEYLIQTYNMSSVEEKRNSKKFDKAREFLKINID